MSVFAIQGTPAKPRMEPPRTAGGFAEDEGFEPPEP